MTTALESASKEQTGREREPAGGQAVPQAMLISDLFREHNESLVRFLAARLRSRQDAKEVAQEAYVRLLSLDKPGAISFLRAFLFKTAANLAVDRMRSHGRRQQYAAAAFDDFQDHPPTPERAAIARQSVECIQHLLSELPPKCRQALLLNRVHGLEPSQVAERMNMSERTIRHYILHALIYFRAGLDEADKG